MSQVRDMTRLVASLLGLVALALGCGDSSEPGGGASFGGASAGGSMGNTGGGGAAIFTGGSGPGGSGPGTGGVGIGIGGSTGEGGTGAIDACATDVYQGEEVPLDMYIVFDRSGSMSADVGGTTLWDATKQAFTGFVQSPESDGIGVGLQFFPPATGGGGFNCTGAPPNCSPGCIPFFLFCVPDSGGSCDHNDYLPPAVMIQPLPPVAPLIVNALNATSPGGGTPTLPAMETAVQATSAYAAQNPARKVIIVLATDGNPNDCNSTIGGVANVAQTAANDSPAVQTFVIGIGNIQGLDQIAQAGGTGNALIVNPATAAQDFLDAMNEIRGKALTCDFQISNTSPNGDPINFGQVNVLFTPPGGMADPIFHVDDASACDPAQGGWYYDDNNNPTQIRTCPATCDRLKGEQGAVQIQLGCDTIDIPH